MTDQRKGKIQTVCGLIEPEDLGPTLMHEHILWDVTRPEVQAAAEAAGIPPVTITLDNVWEINRRSTRDYGNQSNQDHAVALAELIRLRESGGAAIVDLSNFGLKPDPEGLRALSRASGVAIVQGAGYYVDEYIPDEMKDKSVDRLTREIVDQVTTGCWGTDVRAGMIGEIGCMWPLRPFERKVLQASAAAQRETGASINVHPGRHAEAPFEVVDIIVEAGGDPTLIMSHIDRTLSTEDVLRLAETGCVLERETGASINVHPGRHAEAPFEVVDIIVEAGGDPTRLIMSHIDRTLFSTEDVLRLAETGCVLEYDFFGIETSYYWFSGVDLPTDYMRLAYIRTLIERGLAGQVVVSHDICTKTRMVTYGGHGYGHMFRNVVPLMRDKGFTADEIDTITVGNPRRLLSFV